MVGELSGIAVDATDVYWLEGFSGPTIGVFSCGVCGCDKKPKLLASVEAPLGLPGSIAVDETSVYFTIRATANIQNPNSGSVMKCAKSGCGNEPTVLASKQAPQGIAVNATHVYWTNDSQNGAEGTVMGCAKDGCDDKPTLVGSGPQGPEGIAVDANNVYWTAEVPGTVLECPLEGCVGVPTTLAAVSTTSPATPISIAVDATNVYWTLDQNKGNDEVLECPIAGCLGIPTTLASKQIAPGDLLPGGLAVDEQNVYWTNDTQLGLGGNGKLMKCAKSGCGGKPTVVASEIDEPGPIAVDATSIYTRNHYTITKVPK